MKKRINTTLRIPDKLNEILIKESSDRGMSKNSLILSTVWNFIKNNKGEKTNDRI